MKIQSLNVAYNNKVVFNNFNLEIVDGQITCILGSSGVGKTTLINHIVSLAKSQGVKVAVAFQQPRLIEHLTVYENLKLIGYNDEQINEVLESVGLKNHAKNYPNTLSGGEKQRVNFARALLSDSNLLVLDEPFSSLDVKLKISLIKLLLAKTQGKTIVFVTHDLDEALMLSNRIVLIKGGDIGLDYTVQKNLEDREYGKQNAERQVLLDAQLL